LLRAEDEEKGTKGIQHSLEIEIKWFDNDQGGSLDVAIGIALFEG
jgi:hypothetical protein